MIHKLRIEGNCIKGRSRAREKERERNYYILPMRAVQIYLCKFEYKIDEGTIPKYSR